MIDDHIKITFEKKKINDSEIIAAYLYKSKDDDEPAYSCGSVVPKNIDDFISIANITIHNLINMYMKKQNSLE